MTKILKIDNIVLVRLQNDWNVYILLVKISNGNHIRKLTLFNKTYAFPMTQQSYH